MKVTHSIRGRANFSTRLIIAYRSLVIFFISTVYFSIFLLNQADYFDALVRFVNIPDYIRFLSYIEEGFSRFHLSGVNNYSIVFFYSIFSGHDLLYVSFVINLFLFIVGYVFLENVSVLLSGRCLNNSLFFMLLVLTPFVLMINKDIFVFVFFVSVILWWYSSRKSVLFFSLFVSLVKIQLLPVFILFLCFMFISRMGRRVFFLSTVFVYVLLSWLSSFFSGLVFDLSAHENVGFVSQFKSYLNVITIFGGDVVFNILLPIQYVYSLLLSVEFSGDFLQNLISFWKVLFISFFVFNLIYFLRVFYFPWSFFQEKSFPVVVFIISVFLVFMISPIINYRYFLPVVPLLLLLFNCKFKSSIFNNDPIANKDEISQSVGLLGNPPEKQLASEGGAHKSVRGDSV